MSALEEAAAARKEKLIALRKRKAEAENGNVDTGETAEPNSKAARLEFKFRSYDPNTGQARRHDKVLDEEDTVEKATANLAREAIIADEERRKQELDLTNIQPKKPNWDLKRDLEKRLDKLRPRTQAAINTLIRQRLSATQKGANGSKASSGGEDMAEAVSRGSMANEGDAVSEDEDEV